DSTLWTQKALQATSRKANTRREVRRNLNANLRVSFESESQVARYVNAKLLNISGFGLQLLVDEKIPLRTELSCNKPKLGINGRGSVRYCTFSKGKYLVGVEFSSGTGWRDPLATTRT